MSAPETVIEALGIEVGKRALINCDNWFVGPDGRQYSAVFGTVKGCFDAEATLGIKVNLRSADWYLRIGCVTIAGCQIHYAVRCDACSREPAPRWTSNDKGIVEYTAPCTIFFADEAAA